ncbi:MAG: DNA-processing protein DprA [Candidatus Omnitrophica bacterium]|nr:DNA-processing protein DprA [Candidatus Omnitrophota bacterium]
MNTKELVALLLLNRISSLNAKNIRTFVSMYGSWAAMISDRAISEIAHINSAGRRLADRIAHEKSVFDHEGELRLIERNNVDIIPYDDDRYPALLKEIADPPLVLYKKGTLPFPVKPCLSIVGSRNASFYGLEMAEYFAKECAQRGITIVSGFAKGIDSAAHQGALKADGCTIAVFGCGVDVIYPRMNQKLYGKILECGACLSEFPMGIEPFRYNFPQRNRIIAGLARGVLVVEASARSGSLITARMALDEGREVYSIPGKVNYAGAKGTNRLLREGARFVESIEDILEDFPEIESVSSPPITKDKAIRDLSCEEKSVLAVITSRPISVDQITSVIDMPITTLQPLLTSLELKRLISKQAGGSFVVQK